MNKFVYSGKLTNMHAVLTGDIVNSTLLGEEQGEKIIEMIKTSLSQHPTEFFRGDSFQCYVHEPTLALRLALLCRTAAIGLETTESDPKCDVRISIGLGEAEQPVESLATAKGSAFLLSGRMLDAMGKTGGKIVISIENKMASLAFGILSDYINSIFGQMTARQSEVVHELLNGLNQQQVAEKLKRSKSTINQHVTAAKWEEIEQILLNYEKLIQTVSA